MRRNVRRLLIGLVVLTTACSSEIPAADAALGTSTSAHAVAAGVGNHLAPGTPCAVTAKACVDLSDNKAWLLEAGAVHVGPVPITHGRDGYQTPTGVYSVRRKQADYRATNWNEKDGVMPNAVFWNGRYAFYEGDLTESSFGGIRLGKPAAQQFFDGLKVGDQVQVVP
ncbi:L,D-transpeptidase [Pseudonocardiaceae bacterium YIM PH 21723]|nr:L,D-transpeptidase [Pseudonocardiaceae bacterium YIM PH 21723]